MSPLTIAFLGDTILGDQLQDVVRQHGYDQVLGGIAPLLARADFTVVNHEGALADERGGPPESPHRTQYWMRADRDSAAALAKHGVRVASLGNNHVLDHGLDGLASTIEALEDAGIQHCGAGLTEAEARRPVVVAAGGVRVGFVSCIQPYEMYASWLYADSARGGCNLLRENALRDDLDRLAPLADVRIVLVHWGRNYRPLARSQRRWAPELVAAGADLVIGHHPHVVHPVDQLDGAPVLYSLGNGPFGMTGRFESHGRLPYGLLALVEIEPSGQISALELHAIDVANTRAWLRPTPLPTETALPFLRSLTTQEHRWYVRGAALRLDLPPLAGLLGADQLRHPNPGQGVVQQRPVPEWHARPAAPERDHVLTAQHVPIDLAGRRDDRVGGGDHRVLRIRQGQEVHALRPQPLGLPRHRRSVARVAAAPDQLLDALATRQQHPEPERAQEVAFQAQVCPEQRRGQGRRSGLQRLARGHAGSVDFRCAQVRHDFYNGTERQAAVLSYS